jgi:hypothetical protein
MGKHSEIPSRPDQSSRLVEALRLASALTVLATYGVSGSEPAPQNAPRLERCYDTPLPKPVTPAGAEAKQPPIYINKDEQGRVAGDPGMLSPDIYKHVAGAAVRVIDLQGHFSGSGGIIEQRRDSSVVVTAEHTVRDVPLSKIVVRDLEGNSVSVLDGCYMDKTTSVSPDNAELPYDVAILRVSRIGRSALDLAAEPLPRGSFNATFFNFQNPVGPTLDPRIYNAIKIHPLADGIADRYLTGVVSGQSCQPDARNVSLCHMSGGGSGGVVIDRATGDLLGISVASQGGLDQQNRLGGHLDAVQLRAWYGVRVDESLAAGTIWPVSATVMSIAAIQTAYNSPVWRS